MTAPAHEARGIKIALVSYATLFILQFAVFLLTNVLIMLAQSLEVLSDVVVSTFLLLSLSWSKKPADEFHMFGHGRSQNVAGLVAALVMILFMGYKVLEEAVPKFFQGSPTGAAHDTSLALAVIVASMAVLAIPLLDVLRMKDKGASARAQQIQLLKDEAAYIPALVGVVLVGQGYEWADPATSVIIGGIIILGGLYIFKDNVHYLIGRSPGAEFSDKVVAAATSVDGVLGVHGLRAEYVGPNVVSASFHIEVAKGTTIEEADRIEMKVDERVKRDAACQYCVIHVDPARGPGSSTEGNSRTSEPHPARGTL